MELLSNSITALYPSIRVESTMARTTRKSPTVSRLFCFSLAFSYLLTLSRIATLCVHIATQLHSYTVLSTCTTKYVSPKTTKNQPKATIHTTNLHKSTTTRTTLSPTLPLSTLPSLPYFFLSPPPHLPPTFPPAHCQWQQCGLKITTTTTNPPHSTHPP